MFIAKVLVGPEENQLAIYKRGRGFELGATKKQIQVVVRVGLEPRTSGLRVRHADHLATLPPKQARSVLYMRIHFLSCTFKYFD